MNGRFISCMKSEMNHRLETRAMSHENPISVPQLNVDKAHKTLGCWVCPIMNQKKKIKELKKWCMKWVQRVTCPF